MKSSKKIIALILFFVLVFAVGFLIYAYVKVHRPSNSDSSPVVFSVPKGATTREVAQSLESKGIINSDFIFTAYSMLEGANGKIQAGDYQLDRNMSMKQILEALVSGKVTRTLKRVTIVEGAMNSQIKSILVDQGLATPSQFDEAVDTDHDFKFNDQARGNKFEGYLFPDTYQFDVTWDAEQIIERMLANFESRITDQMLTDIQVKDLNMKDVIILASIIEREVGRSSSVQITQEVNDELQREREQVASVFYNRLESKMPLQSDATVNYITGKNDRQALFTDLEVDSPYNTYKYAGLPPGPISNPGIGAIRSVIYPADTDYLYFLSDENGKAYFGKTLEEHNSNRARYLD
ncbi:MAG: endolytic transglycosylase MltG [Candidatus Doudnabacteria bacterium]|nr:endolytic transglycosylase MltG [Candidatus Doudnabacteria bacterium]